MWYTLKSMTTKSKTRQKLTNSAGGDDFAVIVAVVVGGVVGSQHGGASEASGTPAIPSPAPTFDGRDSDGDCISFFKSTSDLRVAVDQYLLDNGPGSEVASIYGFPIGNWCVSKIQDFSYLFNSNGFENPERFNPAAAEFNEDISRWNVSSATSMRSMFRSAISINQQIRSTVSFNQPIGNWDVSSVTDMRYMLEGADAFNQPLEYWNVSSVTDMGATFNGARSFDQPIGKWNVSSVTDMGAMFGSASSFNQPRRRGQTLEHDVSCA
jgi:surface protein